MNSHLNPIHATRPRLLAMLVAAALAAAVTGCGKKGEAPAAQAEAGAGKDEPKKEEAKEGGALTLSSEEAQRAGIKIEPLEPGAFADAVTVTATIRPNQDRIARVAPRVEGRIISVAAKLGDNVKPGQVLAVLDSLAIGEAQSALQQAQSNHRIAQADFKRAESLNADEIIPQREFLKAKSELEKAAAELRAAQDKLRLLGGSPQNGGNLNGQALVKPQYQGKGYKNALLASTGASRRVLSGGFTRRISRRRSAYRPVSSTSATAGRGAVIRPMRSPPLPAPPRGATTSPSATRRAACTMR